MLSTFERISRPILRPISQIRLSHSLKAEPRRQNRFHHKRYKSLAQSRIRSTSLETVADVYENKISLGSDVGVMFSPGGFLVSYYLGVIECLKDLNFLTDSTPVSGTSAGALASAFIVSDLSSNECLEITKEIQDRLCNTGFGWKVIDILQNSLDECLPDDIHLRASGRTGIGVTIYKRGNGRGLFGKVLTEFHSRDEFINAVTASCYIPYYLGPKLGIEWNDGSIYSDGTLTTFFPDTPSDKTSFREDVITVSAMPVANRRPFDKREVDISPDRRHPSQIPGVWKILWNGLVPLRTNEVDIYRQNGYSDTLLWAQSRCPSVMDI